MMYGIASTAKAVKLLSILFVYYVLLETSIHQQVIVVIVATVRPELLRYVDLEVHVGVRLKSFIEF